MTNGNNKKEWWKSKTLWINLIAMVVLIIQAFTWFIILLEEQAAIIIIINLILRAITGEGLTLRSQ